MKGVSIMSGKGRRGPSIVPLYIKDIAVAIILYTIFILLQREHVTILSAFPSLEDNFCYVAIFNAPAVAAVLTLEMILGLIANDLSHSIKGSPGNKHQQYFSLLSYWQILY